METREGCRQEQAHKAQLLDLAQASKSVLLELGSILNQRYRNRGPAQQTQRSLQRKNEVVRRLEEFILEQQRSEGHGNQENHQATIERLEKQLQDQNAAFEQERTRLQQQATVNFSAQADMSSSLKRVLPQLRGLLEAYDREQGQHIELIQETGAPRTVTITGETSNQELTRRLAELQTKFAEERAQLLEQVSEAANTQQDLSRRNLTERESVLTCPISLDLFENPVLTTCCGKTFSSEALDQALRRNPQCPVCRAYRISSHANRDMANLVELHRAERLVLGMPDNSASNSTAPSPNSNDASIEEERPDAALGGSLASTNSLAPENHHRNLRNQRVQDRSAVPHRQSPRSTTQYGITPNVAQPNSDVSSRGRHRGGRSYGSRRRRGSRSSASSNAFQSTTSAAPNSAQSGDSGNTFHQTWRSLSDYYSTQYDSSFQPANTTSGQQSSSLRYGRGPTDDAFNFYPYENVGYYMDSSNSDSDY